MKRWIVILGLGAAMVAGCQKTVTHELDCVAWWATQQDVVEDVADEDTAAPDSVAPDGVTPDSEAETTVSNLATGSACTNNDQCFTHQCFCGAEVTDDCFDLKGMAESFGAKWNYVLTGGMCSKFSCQPDKPAACGDGAFCFDVGPLFQASMVIGLCLASCEEYDDCRYQDGYVCYFTGVEGQRACLPENIVKEIPCGDGVCLAGETEAICPRDCFCGNGSCDSGEDTATCGEDCK